MRSASEVTMVICRPLESAADRVQSDRTLNSLILSVILSEKSATFRDHALGILSMILSEKSATFRDHALAPWRDHAEECALGVEALGDPAAAWPLQRAIDDLPAAALHPCNGRVDAVDVEVVAPGGHRHRRWLGHHAADRGPAAHGE